MSCPAQGPCLPFITQLNLCCIVTGGNLKDPCLTGGQPVPQTIIDNSIQAASELLWAYTGRQYGQCKVKIRPCKKTCGPCGDDKDWFDIRDFGTGFGSFPWVPSLENGVWTNNRTDCGCSSSCCKVCELLYLPSPVCCINEIKIDGVVLGQHQYRVDNFKSVVRLGGSTVKVHLSDATSPAPGSYMIGALQLTAFPGSFTGLDQYFLQGVSDGGGGFFTVSPDKDLSFDIKTDFTGALFDVQIGTAQSNFTVEVLQGGMTVSVVGPTVTVGQWATNQIPGIIRITNHNQPTELLNPPGVSLDVINNGAALTILSASWTDTTSGACWPECQNLSLPDTEPDTFSVTVTYGREVPELIKLATATLTCEFIKACVGQPCQLPQRMTSLTRQGVTVGFLDPQQFFAQGLTGIYLVDLALKTFNPKGLQKQAYAYSPDLAKRWRTETGGSCA